MQKSRNDLVFTSRENIKSEHRKRTDKAPFFVPNCSHTIIYLDLFATVCFGGRMKLLIPGHTF